jgi:hypothetical protein
LRTKGHGVCFLVGYMKFVLYIKLRGTMILQRIWGRFSLVGGGGCKLGAWAWNSTFVSI